MTNKNDPFKSYVTRAEQIKNQKKIKERQEHEVKRKADTRRYFDYGRRVDKHLPSIEPVVLEDIVRALAENPELLAKLREEATKFKK